MEARAEVAANQTRPERAASTWRRRLAVAVKGLAVLYLAALLLVVVALRYVSEGWWITAVALYLPRIELALPIPFVATGLYALGLRRWLWTQIASALLVAFPLMGFVLPWPHGADASAPTMRVMSYNINSGNGGIERIVAEIDAHSPDVVFLQEIGHPAELETLLRSRFPTVDVEGQFVVASRYPLLGKTEPERLPYYGRLRSPRFLQQLLDTPLGRIAFYNVHPVSPREDFGALRGQGLRKEILSGRLFAGGSAPLILANAGLRALQVQTFAGAAARETDPVVLAGDTNLPGLRRILGRFLSPFQDGFATAGWGLGYTYPNDRRPWMRIDRILASDQLRFVRFDVCASGASDHRCVVADLQRR
jgi:endonuclease/exonuclease/phosphatase (EEP) superfamily protein YafD